MWWQQRKAAAVECLDQEHRIRNGSGPFEDRPIGHSDKSWRTVVVGEEAGARPRKALSTRLMKPGLLSLKQKEVELFRVG